MSKREILLLGNPKLYEFCPPVEPEQIDAIRPIVADLHDTLSAFRRKWGAGRAIAAPQIGEMVRLVYMFIDTPTVFINPRFENQSTEMIEVWDDCMSFPELLVKVRRHRSVDIVYRDLDWNEQRLHLDDDLSELLQHEVDHLDGILAVSRAIDSRSFALRSQQKFTGYDRSGLPGV